jgi:hypothetical protein
VRRLLIRMMVVAVVMTALPTVGPVAIEVIPDVVTDEVSVPLTASSTLPTRSDARGTHRSAPIATPIPFTMVGFELPDGVDEVEVRTAGDDGVWSPWVALERIDPDDGPDAGTPEAATDRSGRVTEPLFVGEATRLQVQTADPLDHDVDVRANILDTEGLSGGPVTRRTVRVGGPVAEASTTAPTYVTRAQWGAVPPSNRISYADKVDMTVVHHTAGNNTYTREQAPGIVRGIQRYHMDSQGWSDIGYNALVDRFGTIYEGRAGGLEWAVVGAHARNYNTGSFGVSVMGNFENVDAPQAAYDALIRIIAWKSTIHRMDPLGTTTRTYNGTLLRTISGHRDMGQTACPGLIRHRMWELRLGAADATVVLEGSGNGRPPSPPADEPEPSPSPSPSPSESETKLTDDQRFTDVPLGSTHRNNVLTVHDTNVLLGYTSDNVFRPDNALNRGDMARAVAIGMGLAPRSDWREYFPDDLDYQQRYWLGPYIAALVDAEVVGGYADGTFRPAEPLKRDQMATFLARALSLPPADATFTDVPAGSTHARSIGAVQHAKVTNGISATEYGPGLTMRRDQSASLLVNAFKLAR